VTGTPEDFTKMIQQEYASNAAIIKEAKIKSE
jgi:tripartite-type tricarboxylate transporter receptor subunit TctC